MIEDENKVLFLKTQHIIVALFENNKITDDEWHILKKEVLKKENKIISEIDRENIKLVYTIDDGFYWIFKNDIRYFRPAIGLEYEEMQEYLQLAFPSISFKFIENNNYYFNLPDYYNNKEEYLSYFKNRV